MITKGAIIYFCPDNCILSLKKKTIYLRLSCENSTSQMPSDQSAGAAREISNCAHTLVTESTSSCWPAH